MDRIKYILRNLRDETKQMFNNKIEHFFFNKNKKNQYYSITDIIEYRNIIYKDTPFIFYIKNKIDYLLQKTLESLDKYKIKIGLESEFFYFKEDKSFIKNLKQYLLDNNINYVNIVEEKGQFQYEIQFSPYTDINQLLIDFDKTKQFLIDQFDVNFQALPNYFDIGSSLQINISLNKNDINLFSLENNTEFYNSIAGLLKFTNIFLPLYTNSSNCLKRYDLDLNKYFFSKNKIPAPTFNTWGTNNRTASIRIPTSKNIFNSTDYKKDNKDNKRIEFRIPSADGNLKYILYGVLTSINFGIKYNLQPKEENKNNLLQTNYNEDKIEIRYFSFKDIENSEDFYL